MSARQQHKRRYNLKLQYIADVENWLRFEPPMWRFIAWHRWKTARPKMPSGKGHKATCPLCGRWTEW